MIDYIKGQIIELTPTELILECGGIGYSILISLQTYEKMQLQTQTVAYIHHYIREDEELFFGFATKDERELFRLDEIRQAILSENIARIKSVKGIGLKSAQRLVLELKDKIVKGAGTDNTTIFKSDNNAIVDEATTALVMLGFSKAAIAKVMPALLKENPNPRVEDLIKAALKKL